jgi:hypothetical protein
MFQVKKGDPKFVKVFGKDLLYHLGPNQIIEGSSLSITMSSSIIITTY